MANTTIRNIIDSDITNTLTFHSNLSNVNNRFSCKRYGNIVVLAGNLYVTDDIPNDSVLISGLPYSGIENANVYIKASPVRTSLWTYDITKYHGQALLRDKILSYGTLTNGDYIDIFITYKVF